MSLILRRDHDASTDDFWLVYCDDQDRPVGRVYRRSAPGGAEEWFWGLGFPYTLNEPPPFYGTVATREQAMASFRKCWDRKPDRIEP